MLFNYSFFCFPSLVILSLRQFSRKIFTFQEKGKSDHRRMGNFGLDIEGKPLSYLHLPSGSVLRCIRKGCKFLGTHKERALALFFFAVEAISVVLDLIGKNKEVFLLAAFLLSAFGFAITLYSCVEEKTNTKSLAERQLKAVEVVFSVIQLIVTLIQFLQTVLQVKNSYNGSAFPLAFAMIAVLFIFKKGGKNVDDHSSPRDFHLPLVNTQPIDHSMSIRSTPTGLDQNGTSLMNQVNPTSPVIKRADTHAFVEGMGNDHPVNDCHVLPKNIEVLMPEYGKQRAIDLIVFTCYKDLYKELKNMFSIRLYFNKRPKSHWELIYEDDKGGMYLVGDNSWDEFYHNVRKLYLYKKKSLRNNFMVKLPQILHDGVSPPPAPLPAAKQQIIMEPVTAYDPNSSSYLNDIDIEVPSTLNLKMTAPPPPLPLPPASASVSLDLPQADSEEGLLQHAQAETEASDVTRPINSDLILLVTEGSMLAA